MLFFALALAANVSQPHYARMGDRCYPIGSSRKITGAVWNGNTYALPWSLDQDARNGGCA